MEQSMVRRGTAFTCNAFYGAPTPGYAHMPKACEDTQNT